MSIINDALKKAQQNLSDPGAEHQDKTTVQVNRQKTKNAFVWLIFPLFITTVLVGATLFQPHILSLHSNQTTHLLPQTPTNQSASHSAQDESQLIPEQTTEEQQASVEQTQTTMVAAAILPQYTESAPTLNLNGIMETGENRIALIENKIVEQGMDIKGFTVSSIEADHIIATKNNQTFKFYVTK